MRSCLTILCYNTWRCPLPLCIKIPYDLILIYLELLSYLGFGQCISLGRSQIIDFWLLELKMKNSHLLVHIKIPALSNS